MNRLIKTTMIKDASVLTVRGIRSDVYYQGSSPNVRQVCLNMVDLWFTGG